MLLPLALAGVGCEPGGTPPTVSVTLNGIPASMNGLLVVPPSGFIVNLSFAAGTDAVAPATLLVGAERWGTSGAIGPFEGLFTADASGAVAVFPADRALAPGTYTLYAGVYDVKGRAGIGSLSFAVRNYPGPTPPIGTGQQIWYDFTADRDAVPGADFEVDLQAFGLGSAAAPAVSAAARELVIQKVLARVEQAYGAGGADPVPVVFTDQQPPSGDVTRICVGGEDPSGGITIGSILIDPNNGARNSVECGSIPPTGIFPRELFVWQNAASFKGVFDPLRAAAGGVPIGASIWDVWVLDPSFDPGSAYPDAAARYAVVMAGIDAFANALGSIVAHETGHALGLVPPGAPGIGLFGGGDGAAYTHALNPDGSTPSENFLMKAGNTFSFPKLAGLSGYPLPTFRPIELAYLHDRVVLAPQVTQLLPPPVLTGVFPGQISGSSQLVTVTGDRLVATPAIRLVSSSYTYSAMGEAWQTAQQATCWVIPGQVPAGLYDLELSNPDGQTAVLPAAVQIQ